MGELKEEFTIGAGFSDYQHYVMDESNPKPVDAPHYGDYVHGGIDFRVPAGTPVYSVTGGRVELQLGAKYHSTVTIHELDAAGKDSGRRWVYAHIDADTVPNAVKEAAKNGSALPAGTDIGNVTPWLENVDGIPDQIDRSDAKRYDHLHLNMIVRDSSGKDRYYNSAKYFKIADSVKPTIKDVHFVPDNQSNSFAGDSPILSGKVDVLINAVDHINGWDYRGGQLSENPNGASFDLGVHQARVKIKSVRTGRIVHNSETPAFDHMPDPSDRSTVHNAYVREVKANGVIHRARGDRFGRKNFLAATNVVNGKFNSDGHWDTRSVANGDYQVEITVKDFSGNKTTTTRLVHVSNQ